jgi:Bacterial regulatory protein, arsR family
MSTKMQHQIIDWRRAKVMELLSKGESNQSEIARILQVDKSIICRDIAYLKLQAKTTSKDTLMKGCQRNTRNVLLV